MYYKFLLIFWIWADLIRIERFDSLQMPAAYLYERLTKTLLLEIASGMYRNGQRFLSVRDIERIWNVSEPTVLTSLRWLAEKELLKPRKRSGHFLIPGFQTKALLLSKKERTKPLQPILTLQQKVRRLRGQEGGEIAFLAETVTPTCPETVFDVFPEKLCSHSVIRCVRQFEKECANYHFKTEYLLYPRRGPHPNSLWIQQHLAQKEYAGIVVFCRSGFEPIESTLHASLKKQVPTVILYDDCQGLPVNSVNLNNVGIGYDAIKQLYHQGHRKITVLVMDEKWEIKPQESRLEGCRLAAAEASRSDLQMEVLRICRERPYSPALRRHFTNPKERPTAVFACKSHLVPYLYPLWEKLELRVPEDLSVIICSSKDHVYPLNIQFDFMNLKVAGRIGRIAARQLDLIQRGEPLEKSVLINASYMKRKSTRTV